MQFARSKSQLTGASRTLMPFRVDRRAGRRESGDPRSAAPRARFLKLSLVLRVLPINGCDGLKPTKKP